MLIKPKWTHETVTEAAKNCKSATEFKEKYSGAYYYAHKTDLWKSFTWLKHNTDPDKKTYAIYAYEDAANMCVYVGLTNNIARRIKEHRKKNYKNHMRTFDIVRQHFEDRGLELPEPIVLRDGLDGFEAQELEDKYKDYYVKKGWNLINTGKTGPGVSSLGNLSWKRPSREECEKTAAGCRTRKELSGKSWLCYTTILMNGWDDLLPPKQRRLTVDDWRHRLSSYGTRRELADGDMKSYIELKKRSLLDELFPSAYAGMDKESVFSAARAYGARGELKKNDFELWDFCNGNGWLGEIFAKQPKAPYRLTYEECREIASKYGSRSKFAKKDCKAYRFAKENGWLDRLFPLARVEWTVEGAMKVVSAFENRESLKRHSQPCYRFLLKNGLLDSAYPKRAFKTDLDECLALASGCRTWTEFAKRHERHARFCKDNGLDAAVRERIAELNPKPEKGPCLETVKEACLESAKKCATKLEFRSKYKQEYRTASHNGWLKEYGWLAGCKGSKDEGKKKNVIETAKRCSTKKEFREGHPKEYILAVRFGLLKDFTWLKGCKKETKK